MTDSIIRADAMLSARLPGVTATSLRTGTVASIQSVYESVKVFDSSAVGAIAYSGRDGQIGSFSLACLLIIAVEFGERFVYYVAKNMYGTYTMQMLNMSNSDYALFGNFNDFWNYGTPLLGAYVADAFLGRFKTICLSAPIYICGLILLTVSASPLGFGDFPFYPDSNGGWAYAGFWAAVTIMGLGCGFIKPCVSVFAAEQLKDKDGNDASPRTLEKLYLYW